MIAWTAESWMRQRGTFPTTAQVLSRDLGVSLHHAGTQLCRLARQGLAVRIAPGRYVHTDTFPEHRMAILVLLDATGTERHRADFPTRDRAEVALYRVERDLRERRPTVTVIGRDLGDMHYTVSGVARAMVQPAPQPAPVESDTTAFDARARAAGDDQ